jgi:hypothetical protein
MLDIHSSLRSKVFSFRLSNNFTNLFHNFNDHKTLLKTFSYDGKFHLNIFSTLVWIILSDFDIYFHSGINESFCSSFDFYHNTDKNTY